MTLPNLLRGILVLPLMAAGAEPRIEFDTNGGDAWTFDLHVAGRASKKFCDSVTVHSQRSTVVAVQFEDRFTADIPLQQGDNRVQATCHRSGREIERTDVQRWHVALPETPKAWARVVVSDGMVYMDAGGTEAAAARPAPVIRYEWFARAGNPAPLHLRNGQSLGMTATVTGERIELATPPRDGEYYVQLKAVDALGRVDQAGAVFRVVSGQPQAVDLHTEHPAWVDSLVLYGAAPYNFDPQNFQGIRQRLDEIAALGATAVWLSPVNQAATDDFGYSVVNHFALREQFGSEQEFRALVDEAHRLGLRVLVDFVPNHLSDQNAYYLDAKTRGPRSPYYDWFERDAAGEITHYFDWKHLQNLDFDNPEVRNYITAALAKFVRELNIDGFRVDASWAVARRAPEFWPQLRRELKRIDPDIFLLAEASAREPYHVANGFDAAYDWTGNLGEWAWRDVFPDDGAVKVERLRAALTNDGRGFPRDSLILRFINNNDTGERFITRHGRPLATLAATMLLTLPGLPLIYNGDEVGASFEPYDEGPPIQWNDDDPLTAHYRRLTKLRREQPALRTRDMVMLRTTAEDAVLGYLRPGSAPEDDVLVLLNFSERQLDVGGADPQSTAVLLSFRQGRELLSQARFSTRAGRAPIRIGPMSALIILRR